MSTSDLFARHLAETGWLAERLEDPALRIYDCTTHLLPATDAPYRIESGRADYDAGHIPGADFIDLQGELSRQDSPLRFMLPGPAQFAEVASAKGIGPGTRVVLYSTTTPQWATRVWWMLRAYGFDDAMVLDGGLPKWRAEGRPISTAPARYPPARFEPRPRPRLFAGRDEVLAAVGAGEVCVLNALSAEQHAGGGRSYGRPGRIAGSANVPAATMLDTASGVFLDRGRLAEAFASAGATKDRRVITYCGGGIAATLNAVAHLLVGNENVAVYDGSLFEWKGEGLPVSSNMGA